MTQLRGMTWGNVRGFLPLKATSEAFERANPEIKITWDVRSLKDFADYPIELLAQKYDLILLDHPHIGISTEKNVLVAMDEYLSAAYLADQAANSTGRSHESYAMHGKQWALAVDAAAQVAAYRPELLEAAGGEAPSDWDSVFRLAEKLPSGVKVGIPLIPTDCICSFITLSAQIGGDEYWTEAEGIQRDAGVEALELLQRLAAIVHPISFKFNPIGMLDYMTNLREIAYVPLTFGYSQYSRPGFVANPIQFTNIPKRGGRSNGALLGGVGLAVSSLCKDKEAAFRYVEYACSPETQKGLYYEYGGQPGHKGAWTDEQVNARCSSFFQNTLETLELSYLRPRHPGYNEFQEQAGDYIFDWLTGAGKTKSAAAAFDDLNSLYLKLTAEAQSKKG